MKCMYYLAPNLISTHQISDNLREAGVEDWCVHIISKDEEGIKRDKLHSSNWLETTDLLRDGFIGAGFGFMAGIFLAFLLMYFQPLGPNVPYIAALLLIIVATLFGAWLGGLIGIDSVNHKLQRFLKEIEAGQLLILIYVRKGHGDSVKTMMRERHPQTRHVATDRHFINPFSDVEQKQPARQP